MPNIQLTPIQVDYKDYLETQSKLQHSAESRIMQIRKEVTKLHLEETKLESIVESLKLK